MFKKSPRPSTKIMFDNTQTLTEQQHKSDVNLNNIVKQEAKTGIRTHTPKSPPTFQNQLNAPDFYQAQCIIANAKSLFENIPALTRQYFNNDAGQYVEFMTNPENIDSIDEMGLDSSHLSKDSITLSDEDQKQVHLEDLIASKIKQEATPDFLNASPEQLQARLDKLSSAKDDNS